jgi:hypothetical protein
MLEVRDHLDGCHSCTQEYLAIRQAKILLRTVSLKDPGPLFEERVTSRIASDRPALLPTLFPTFWHPNRGRRLAYAMALSFVGVLSVAARFGSETMGAMASRPSVNSQIAGLAGFDNRAPGIMSSLSGMGLAAAPSAISVEPSPAAVWNDARRPPASAYQAGYDLWNAGSVGGYGSGNVSLAGYSR